ncbi:hypothetical protein QCA50_001458 [Cerrena zonata]|uniref:Spc7 kinetochore protein domain-containing protein n=1 Tax=Cerrena zonata TaxID=2478898 RepID=A0AAW0GQT5_9APHY
MTTLPKISPNRRRSIAVLNQGSTAHSAPQRRRRAYSIAPGENISPATRARRLRVPRKSILKQSVAPSETPDDTLSTAGETTESRRVSFAAHAHVLVFEKEKKLSAGKDNTRRRSRGGETEDQQARFADDNGGDQGNDENIDPQTGTQRRKSMRRRSSTAFSEFGERSMDMDDEDEEGPPATNFLDEYLGEEQDWGDEEEDFEDDEDDDEMGMDITEAIDPRIIRKRSLSLGGAQQIGRRRSSALPTMTSSLRNSENQPPVIEESDGEHGEDDDTGRYNHNRDDYTTSSSGNTTSFLSSEGSSTENTGRMEFTIPINKPLRPASQDDLWLQLRAVTHAGATDDPDQSQEMEEEPYEEGAVIPLEEFEQEETGEPMELTTALDRLTKARESMGLNSFAAAEDEQDYDDMEEDSYTSSNGSFGMDRDGNETINVTALMRHSLGGQSSLMDETDVFRGITRAAERNDESIRIAVNGHQVEPQPEPQSQSQPDQQQANTQTTNPPSVFRLPRVFSAPSSQEPSPSSAPSNPPQPQASTSSIPSRPFTFSQPVPQSPARPSSVTRPTQSSLAKQATPSQIPKPVFRGSAAFAPPTTPKSPKKRAAVEGETAHEPEDRPSPAKKQAVQRLQPNQNRVSFHQPDPNTSPESPEPPALTHANGLRRASILRRPSGYFAQRKSLAPGKTVTGLNVQNKSGRASLGAAPSQDSAPVSLYPDVSRIMEEDPPTPQRTASPRVASPAIAPATNGVTHSDQETAAMTSPTVATVAKTSPTSTQALARSVFEAPRTTSVFRTSLYPQIPDDLRTQDMDLTTRTDLVEPDEDSTEPINPEQWRNDVQSDVDDDGPPISIEQFFDMTKIRFMDEIAAPRRSSIHPNRLGQQRSRRRSLNSSTNGADEAEDVPLAEFVTTLSVELPQLELYSTIAGELRTWIEESKKMCKEADEEAIKMTPGLFREFADVDEGEREFLIHQLKLIKAYCHGMARSQWYDWRKTWTEQLQAAADEAFSSLESDALFLENIRKETSAMLPALRDEYAQVMAELEKEQTDIAEIEEQDQDTLNELKATIADQDLVIEGYSTDISEAKAKLERLEEKLAEIEAQKQDALDAISQAQQIVHIQKESTSTEVFRLKDELEALEILHQWRMTKISPSLVEFIYAGRFAVSIPCIKFMPLPSRITIQRTKASKFERDSFPQYTEMMTKGALKLISKMSSPTLRQTVQQLSDFWSSGAQLRRQLDLLNIQYPLSLELVPSSGNVDPSVVATATIMLESVKAKAFISFPLDLDICSKWPKSTSLLKTDVKIAYGKADPETVRESVQTRLEKATPSDNYCCLLDACLAAKAQYD